MKRGLLIFFMALSISSYADIMKFKANAFAFRERDEYTNEWMSWSDWQEDNSLIVMDKNTDVITIYGKHKERLDAIDYISEFEDDEHGHNVPVLCIDSNGEECKFVVRWTEDKSIQLYLRHSDHQCVYSVEWIQ